LPECFCELAGTSYRYSFNLVSLRVFSRVSMT
jgi:hypothetical protein